ncbi:Capsular polysaccharide synthesis protein [Rothia dentocariosa]|jgi:hypothetical protein|nr:Capsular polysaccharide synthesis protein [Rothia dentocariosa]
MVFKREVAKGDAMSIISFSKSVKHYLWVNYVKDGNGLDKIRSWYSQKNPYSYDLEKYTHRIGDVVVPNSSTFSVNHLFYDSQLPKDNLRDAPNQIFVLWTGDNEITPARRKSLNLIRSTNPESKVILVTPDNLDDYIVPGYPLHPSYVKLSYIQRSDYMRAYLMHHHGGVYMDIKPMDKPWLPLLEELNATPDMWVIAPHEKNSRNSSPASGVLGKDQRNYYRSIVNMSAYACKPYSRFTDEWISEIHRRMDYFSTLLEGRYNSQAFEYMPEYPVPWSDLSGNIVSPLSLKYKDNIKTIAGMQFEIYSGGYR